MRVGRNQRVAVKTPVVAGVVDHHDLAWREDGVGTESDFTRGLGGGHPHLGLEPLPLGIDQRDDGDRRTADMRRQIGNVVVGLLLDGIENGITLKRRQSRRLVGG